MSVNLPNPRPSLTRERERLLRLRLEMERREPRWMRVDEWRYKRIRGTGWRRPRGLDNKIRQQRKGWPPRVKAGYRQPVEVRGLHPTGFEEVLVYRPEDVDRVDPARQAIRIAAAVGLRKRVEIIRRAIERGVRVLNPDRRALEILAKTQSQQEVKTGG